MPNCYICKDFCKNFKILFHHYRVIHKLKEYSTYICTEDKCTRKYLRLNSFRKHILHYHLQSKVKDNYLPNKLLTVSPVNADNSNLSCPDLINLDFDFISSESLVPDSGFNDSIKENFDKTVLTAAVKLITCLYGKSIYPRNLVDNIIQEICNIFHEPCNFLNDYIEKLESENKIDMSTLKQMLCSLSNIFKNLNTEHNRFAYLTKLGDLILPVECIIGQSLIPNHSKMRNKQCFTYFIPLRETLKKFLELPDVFTIINNNMKKLCLNDMIISNIVQSQMWKSKIKGREDDIIFPLILYFDELELGNPLGSRAALQKIAAFYLTIPIIPSQFNSQLENIFLIQLVRSNYLKEFEKRIIFSKLINELKFLEEEGIVLNLPQGNVKVYFLLALIVGDNLGLNTILGFTESFSSNYFCRFCKIPKRLTRTLSIYNNESLRNKENYEIDSNTMDYNTTGIKEKCVWHEIPSFHVTTNYSVDIMHDILEGVAPYEIALILNYFIGVKKYFSLSSLNLSIKFFYYGPDEKNKPPCINYLHLKNNTVKMSASEMLVFVRYLPLLCGPFVPKTDKYWKLFLLLKEILSLTLSKYIQPGVSILLKSLITEHHSLFLKLCNVTLKPKHHLMLHYSDIMEQIGPLSSIWCMRFEAKHRTLKQASNVVASRKNICKTLSLKQQLNFCWRMVNHKGFDNSLKIGSRKQIENLEQHLYVNFNILKFPESFKTSCTSVEWISIFGTNYKVNYILVVDYDELPVFGIIKQIFINGTDILYIYQKLDIVLFDEHLCSFLVTHTEKFDLIFQSNLPEHTPLILVARDMKYYVPYSWYN